MGGIVETQLPRFDEVHQIFVGECLLVGLKHREIARLLREHFPDFGKNTSDTDFESIVMNRIKPQVQTLRTLAEIKRLEGLDVNNPQFSVLKAHQYLLHLEQKMSNPETDPVSLSKVQLQWLRYISDEKSKFAPASGAESGTSSGSGDGDGDDGVPTSLKSAQFKDKSSFFAPLSQADDDTEEV